MRRWAALAIAGVMTLCASNASAGPPYITDDPEPVEYRHWELYLASLVEHDAREWTGTSPHFEVNYGAVPDLQLHLLVPLAFAVRTGGGTFRAGPGDTELGFKWRFVHEGEAVPQIGIFPLLEVPTGMAQRGLGNGAAQVFLPLWLQKSLGRWTTYGGGGPWFNAAAGTRTWWYAGWQIQRQVIESLSVGAEVFYETPKVPHGSTEARFNVGFVLDIGEHHHLLGSAGRGFVGPNLFQGYVAWLVTFGPAGSEPLRAGAVAHQ
jgi:hypothetical protein